MPANTQGTKCSPGSSGSALLDGNGRFRGTQVSYGESAEALQYAQNKFDVNMDHVAAVCAFVTEMPTAANGGITAAVNAPPDFQFEGEQLEQLEQRYHDQFFSPNFTRQIIDGVLRVDSSKGTYAIDRPVVYYDQATDTTLIGSANPATGDLVLQGYHGQASLNNLTVYQHDGQLPDFTSSTGTLVTSADAHYFQDEHGVSFGNAYIELPGGNVSDQLVVKDGQLTLVPIQLKP
jgi:hypothetical protein